MPKCSLFHRELLYKSIKKTLKLGLSSVTRGSLLYITFIVTSLVSQFPIPSNNTFKIKPENIGNTLLLLFVAARVALVL